MYEFIWSIRMSSLTIQVWGGCGPLDPHHYATARDEVDMDSIYEDVIHHTKPRTDTSVCQVAKNGCLLLSHLLRKLHKNNQRNQIQKNPEKRNTMEEGSNSQLEHILVIVLVVIFGSGAWVSVSGIWTELPILIANGLPEEYRITSIVNILIQLACVGTIGFLICNKLSESTRVYRPEIPVNYVITFIGTIATFLLIFFWGSRIYWSGQYHSVAFLSLLWFVALVDITSNTTFVGYMSLLKPSLINWFWIGEGMGHIVPAFVTLVQRSGSKGGCIANFTFVNTTVLGNSSITYNCTSWQEVAPQFLFEPGHYFGFLFVIMLSCHISFICLNTLPCARREYAPQRGGHHLKTDGCGGLFPSRDQTSLSSADEGGERILLVDSASSDGNGITPSSSGEYKDSFAERHLTKRQVVFLYTAFFLNFTLAFGVLSPILGFSGSAYGSSILQLIVPLQQIAVAFAYFVFLLKPIYSFTAVAVSLVLALLGFTYVLVVACMSPYPPFSSLVIGKLLIVLVYVVTSVSSRYCHASTVWILRNNPDGRKHLILSGAIGQAGVFLGSTTMFVLINIYNVFEANHESKACPSDITCIAM